MPKTRKQGAVRRDNQTGHTGVFWNRYTAHYHAEITINKRKHNLGMFKTVEQAIAARLAAELERDGLDLL